ncbi:MAG: MerR family transcriptional regulator [Myxococcales bacterium]|nr:MerR family transcriptional regulator [Myxococcales bacterium]
MTHPAALKVAAVARRTGVSVRTLHYYEEIGLLAPSGRTASGHRLYTPEDIERLQRIKSLQALGLSLAEIGDCLAEGRMDLRETVQRHLRRVEAEREVLERLERQLRALDRQLAGETNGDALTTETLLNALEQITMYDQYFTPAEQKRLEAHAASGEDVVTPVLAELEAARVAGLPPSSAEAQRSWQRFREAVESVAGGDAAMTKKIFELLHAEPKAREDHGISDELFAYLGSVAGGSEH